MKDVLAATITLTTILNTIQSINQPFPIMFQKGVLKIWECLVRGKILLISI